MWDDKKEAPENTADEGDNFWSLPVTHTKSYRQPSFEGRTMDTVPIGSDEDEKASHGEKIPPREKEG